MLRLDNMLVGGGAPLKVRPRHTDLSCLTPIAVMRFSLAARWCAFVKGNVYARIAYGKKLVPGRCDTEGGNKRRPAE